MLSRRLSILSILVVVIISALVIRLWFLQIVNGPFYRTQSENNRIHLQKIPPFRGMITDRKGELLVDNRPSFDLYIIPEDIQDRKQFLGGLRFLIDIDIEQISNKLDKTSNLYSFRSILIKKDISRDELAAIETHLFNLPGLSVQPSLQRSYLFENFASHVIGYMGEINEIELKSGKYPDNGAGDLIGKSGVEGKWHNYLNGMAGGKQVEVDAAGRKLRDLSVKPPVSGMNITLTIDKDLQSLAEKNLKDKKGAIVALDPNNGEILAMASSPAIDPNMFINGMEKTEWEKMISSGDSPMQNRAISGQYPPGSLFKIAMALAGLEEGFIDPDELITCTGAYTLGNHTYQCWKEEGHGSVDFQRAITESCDIYFYKIGMRLGIDKIANYAKMCGLGQKTGFELGNEAEGLIPTSEWKLKRFGVPWQLGETVSSSIGQSYVSATPLQMVRLISAVFNGGKLYQPKIVRHIGNESQDVYRFTPTLTGELGVRQENLELLKKALISVVNDPQGTGAKAKIQGIRVAGKTGTAQVVALEKTKNLDSDDEISDHFKDHAWFVAIAPVENPQIALVVLIEHGGHGSSGAAPIARDLIKKYLNIDQ
jgi:penicillin-binding protein 2